MADAARQRHMTAEDVQARVHGTADDVAERVKVMAGRAGEVARDVADRAGPAVHDAAMNVKHTLERMPPSRAYYILAVTCLSMALPLVAMPEKLVSAAAAVQMVFKCDAPLVVPMRYSNQPCKCK